MLVPLFLAILSSVGGTYSSWVSIVPQEREYGLEAYYKSKENRWEDCRGSEHAERLQLSKAGMSNFPRQFVLSANVTAISAEDNHITSVRDDAFADLPNLRCLSLARNQLPLSEFKASESLQKLETLVLNDQGTIRSADIYAPTINLRNLKRLDIGGNGFSQIAENFSVAFPNLVYLNLSYNEINYAVRVQHLPVTLKHLHLEGTRLSLNSFQPATVFPNVHGLYLDGRRGMRVETEELNWRIVADQLRILSLSSCKLSGIKSELVNWNVTTMDLSDNQISAINWYALPTKLEKLSLSHNRLTDFGTFVHLKSLTTLYLSYNAITEVKPTSFQALTGLQTLSLRGNGIREIDSETFSASTNLRELDLAENLLSHLPRNWMKALTSLRYLNLNSNKFVVIEDAAIGKNMLLEQLLFRNHTTAVSLEALASLPMNVTLYI